LGLEPDEYELMIGFKSNVLLFVKWGFWKLCNFTTHIPLSNYNNSTMT
jgi:hypothetical protein